MADPLSVLGAAVGVTSLIIQITDECIKGFKFYHEAANLPEVFRYLRVRVQIEQQRFLNFGLEAGILYEDGVLCNALQVNRSLLIAVLAEIKILLENYAEKNGKYEQLAALDDVDWDDDEEPSTNLMDLLCLPSDKKTGKGGTKSEGRREGALKRIRKVGNNLTQEGRNLRNIIVEPKRLIWAAVDKDSFEAVISKLESLNSFLIALLDSTQLRRLQDTMSTSYLEILQLRNDIASLTTLVEALAPTVDNQRRASLGNIGPENNSLSLAIAEEITAEEKRKKYLKQLVEIKIQFTKMDQEQSGGTALDSTKSVATPLVLRDFEFAGGSLASDTLNQRTFAIHQGRRVWIEWKDTATGNGLSLNDEHVERRIGLLIDLLRFVKPDGFRVLPCLGYVKILDSDDAIRYGIVFEEPVVDGERSKLVTLRELLGREPKPSLSTRVSCCAVLARCVHSFHTVNWLHKALRADNILFFSSAGPPDLRAPFVSGFELSRPSIINEMTEKPGFDPFKDISRHPDTQSGQTDGSYRKSYDIYSLGVLIMEIALWKRIEDIVGLEDLSKTKPLALREVQSWLLDKSAPPAIYAEAGHCLPQVASACGDVFCNVVEHCLKTDILEEPAYLREKETADTAKQQRSSEQDIVKKLEHLASVL